MENNLLIFILTILACSGALNLKLTFALQKAVNNALAANDLPLTLPIGSVLPSVTGKRLSDRETLILPNVSEASVLLFLSSTCPKCRTKLAEIERFLPLLDDAGLNLWLVSQEPRWRLKRFLHQFALSTHAVMVNKRTFKSINPSQMSPYYLFLDHTGTVEAGGAIGDDNWMSFLAQMDEIQLALSETPSESEAA